MNANNWSAAEIWTVAADRLKQKNELLYRQWFQNMTPLRLEENTLTLGVSDDFFASIIADEYDDLMVDALQGVGGSDFSYRLEPGHAPVPAPARVPATAASPERPARPPREKLVPRPGPQNCLAEHTFENFIVGAENRYAFAAAKTAAEEPGVYNPLYLYGASGVGKTHLLQAVTAEVHKRNPAMVVRYATCDELLNDFYNLLQQHKSLSEFRSSVRDVDVLLVDDIHSLAKKTQMQEEFFNLFNTLYGQHKQIILTSDRQPCEISDILGEKRTRTVAEPRMIAMYLCRELTSNSSTEIGAAFGRNHATILHAEKKVPQLCSENEIIRRSITQLKRQLQRG